ncbi:2-C-methyl-D-erythritol 4-phosphate cytidylyltransferase [Hymenobacter rubripertinctus]|uniref:2-C-methyl-D-erythritol 4-phosphate cytidylyltransferase n=1 Tax=Hymenobacter rubripertinctus TaxID=2029981 RepID=A0A418R202_9BACT|nr:2-C-methyl-D-erythritol 4-phosphate cytidylyltransferase [Hymenobacter rubripertinctus]RIY11510.1 2-C-methyl-D-erythritol 4-phosphate cytidylyltransferase [Hymenobacter rubripertinctus]
MNESRLPTSSAPQYPRYAIIVAGGSGTRMGTDRPKQFLELAGEPVLLHTLRRFAAPALGIRELILVLPAEQLGTWQELCGQYGISIPHTVVAGGATRWASVRAGLNQLAGADPGVVAVHDGVRPLTPPGVIEATYQAARNHGAAVAAVVPKDSVRNLSQQGSYALNRARLRLVQTPQCFDLDLLRRAYQLPELSTFTDDASVVEDLHPISLVEGDYRNLKITTPEDLFVAEALLRMRDSVTD